MVESVWPCGARGIGRWKTPRVRNKERPERETSGTMHVRKGRDAEPGLPVRNGPVEPAGNNLPKKKTTCKSGAPRDPPRALASLPRAPSGCIIARVYVLEINPEGLVPDLAVEVRDEERQLLGVVRVHAVLSARINLHGTHPGLLRSLPREPIRNVTKIQSETISKLLLCQRALVRRVVHQRLKTGPLV